VTCDFGLWRGEERREERPLLFGGGEATTVIEFSAKKGTVLLTTLAEVLAQPRHQISPKEGMTLQITWAEATVHFTGWLITWLLSTSPQSGVNRSKIGVQLEMRSEVRGIEGHTFSGGEQATCYSGVVGGGGGQPSARSSSLMKQC
jgi:hypothetical protein